MSTSERSGVEQVLVGMPLRPTPEMIEALRNHPETAPHNPHDWHLKLSWFMCAYAVVVRQRISTQVSE